MLRLCYIGVSKDFPEWIRNRFLKVDAELKVNLIRHFAGPGNTAPDGVTKIREKDDPDHLAGNNFLA